MQPDILIFLSDQHHGDMLGCKGNPVVKTPHIDQLAQEGILFNEAYTTCPLCVPSRLSFLTGQMPSKLSVFNNDAALAADDITFLHSLAMEGYETVLCGRMHFKGPDQRHGFTKRIMGEITPLYWGRGGKERKDLGRFAGTFAVGNCLNIIGGGESPVLDYDRAVIKAALSYLEEEHERPQCIVVGTYAPHFTYIAPKDLYDYYLDKVELPAVGGEEYEDGHPVYNKRGVKIPDQKLRSLRAAYYGMITNMDNQVGEVRAAWDRYLKRSKRKGCFIYMSDHGDQIGEHNLVGKQSFYEGSIKIPLVIQGDGIEEGIECNDPTSIMDLAPSLCKLTDSPIPPHCDGLVIPALFQEEDYEKRQVIYSEFMDKHHDGSPSYGYMVKRNQWKYISYSKQTDYDMLFDLAHDPFESNNVIEEHPSLAQELKNLKPRHINIDHLQETYDYKNDNVKFLAAWGKKVKPVEAERWAVPQYE